MNDVEAQLANSSVSRGDADDTILLSQHHQLILPLPPVLQSLNTDLPRSDPSSPKTLTPNTTPADHSYFKTRPCINFTRGFCGYGEGCTFAHGREQLRNNYSSWEAPTRVCKMYLRDGNCTYGATCTYLHLLGASNSGAYKRTPPALYKTNPCFSWKTSGRCSYGAHCKFIHAHEDSRKKGASVEAEEGHRTGGSDGSSRSKGIFSFKPTVIPSRLKKKGYEKLNAMKKVNGIYGDWLE